MDTQINNLDGTSLKTSRNANSSSRSLRSGRTGRALHAAAMTSALGVAVFHAGVSRLRADTTVTWDGSSGHWTNSNSWGLEDPCFPTAGNCKLAGPPPILEYRWHVIVPATGPVLSLDTSVDLVEAVITGWINIPSPFSYDMVVRESTTLSDCAFTGSGVMETHGDLYLAGLVDISSRDFDNYANAFHTGTLRMSDGVFTNYPGAGFDCSGNSTVYGINYPSPEFHNDGVLYKTSGGTSRIGIDFTSTGTVNAVEGVLSFSNPGVGYGPFIAQAGGLIEFNQTGDPFVLTSSATVEGPGVIRVAAGSQVDSSATWTAEVLHVTGGILNLATPASVTDALITGGAVRGRLDVNRFFEWSGGRLESGLYRAIDGGVIGDNGGAPVLDAAQLTLEDGFFEMPHTNGIWLENGAALVNDATSTLHLASWYVYGNTQEVLYNAGDLRKLGPHQTVVQCNVTNEGLLQIDEGQLFVPNEYVQNAGETRLIQSSLGSYRPVEINGGALTGSGTIQTSVNNHGEIRPGDDFGALAISYDLNLSNTSSVVVELGGYTPADDYDRIEVGGQVTIDGQLEVRLANGFQPQHGDSFEIMTYWARTGRFSGMRLPRLNDPTMRWRVEYGDHAIVLHAFKRTPQVAAIN